MLSGHAAAGGAPLLPLDGFAQGRENFFLFAVQFCAGFADFLQPFAGRLQRKIALFIELATNLFNFGFVRFLQFLD